jgi:adenosine deaminase
MTTKTGDLPKVVLHDHLIGGLRASTFIELADATGYRRLPTSDPVRLDSWIRSAGAGDLGKLLWIIDHGVAVTQTPEALERMAFEAIEDLTNDGVIYAEVRMAPGPNAGRHLTSTDVVEAVLAGINGAERDSPIEARLVLTALRDGTDSAEIAQIAVAHRDQGVVGFDLAGKETDQPLAGHTTAIQIALDGGIGVTIHAGEEAGPDSINEALDAGAQRIGVAYTLRDDITQQPDGSVALGAVAKRLLDEQTPVELCPTSDGVLHGEQPAHHHFEQLHPAGLNVSLNTDNRLISGSSMTGEFELALRFLALDMDDLRQVTHRSIDAAFCDDLTKESLRAQVDEAYGSQTESDQRSRDE